MSSKAYDEEFFRTRNEKTRHAAGIVLDLLLSHCGDLSSAADVGCGVGTWLAVLKEKGAKRVLGIDGPWVPKEYLEIAQEEFLEADLTKPLKTEQRFALAISLEVAEHIPEVNAKTFVESLTTLADLVLFSAAIPFQGGDSHVNEQWPEYWFEIFGQFGYRPIDCVRPAIWNERTISSFYRQNMLVFANDDAINHYSLGELLAREKPRGFVHPEMFEKKMIRENDLGFAFKLLLSSIKSSFLSRKHPPRKYTQSS
jgi:SAM-dependent methyltransferase